MAIDTRSPFALHGLTLAPVNEASSLVQVPQTATVVDVKREIERSAAELKQQRTELAAATKGTWESASKTWLQGARRFVCNNRLTRADAVVPVAVGGAVVGGLAGYLTGYNTTNLLGWQVGLAILGAALAMGPVAAVTSMLGAHREKRARGRMVELTRIEKPLARFQAAEGAEKAQILAGLEKLERCLDKNQAASPEALVTLRAAIAEGADVKKAHGERVRQFALFGGYLHGVIDAEATYAIDQTLKQMSPTDRAVAAEALRQLVFADRKRVAAMPYEVRNKLYGLLTASAAEPPAITRAA